MQVTFGMSIGGMERVIMELCRYVDPSRYKLSICCISKRGPLADIMESEGVPVVLLRKPVEDGEVSARLRAGACVCRAES